MSRPAAGAGAAARTKQAHATGIRSALEERCALTIGAAREKGLGEIDGNGK